MKKPKTTLKPLFVVLILPVHNRQNILDVLSHLIKEDMKGYGLSGKYVWQGLKLLIALFYMFVRMLNYKGTCNAEHIFICIIKIEIYIYIFVFP